MSFRPGYALAAVAIFVVEVCIALFLHDWLIRPYGGDSLAVALVYCGLRAVTRLRVWPAAGVALSVAFAVEFAQGIGLVSLLGLGGNAVARTVLGTHFEPLDFLAYTVGALGAVVVEALRLKRSG